jgi:hypothetical protein
VIKTSISARSRSRRRGVDRRSSQFPMKLKITPGMFRELPYPSTVAVAGVYLIPTPVRYSTSMPARTPAKAAQGLWRSAAPFQIICLPIW